jgi:hypothetical protein
MVPFISDERWPKFRDDPVEFYLRADEPTQDQIWALIEVRQPKRPGKRSKVGLGQPMPPAKSKTKARPAKETGANESIALAEKNAAKK